MTNPCALHALALLVVLGVAESAHAAERVRVATFNVSLYGQKSGEVLARLQAGDDPQAQHLAEIIQRVRPDVLLLNEIDYDPQNEVLRTFREKYLAVPQHASKSPSGPAEPLVFPHQFAAPVNTGRHSGFDLDRSGGMNETDGNDQYAADAWGYGRYEGQYGMAILSKFPIDAAAVRTFRTFRWKDMPGAQLPDDPATPDAADWYSAEALAEFPLSSKSHWDVPVLIDGKPIHLLASHPTPPVFDGEEDRNGRRNRDEIRFWADYVGGLGAGDWGLESDEVSSLKPQASSLSSYIYDDNGLHGGLGASATADPPTLQPTAYSLQPSFLILGDLNGDPHDGDGSAGISALLASPRLRKFDPPASEGAVEQARLQAGANLRHRGDANHDTCDPADDPGPGTLRLDYVLPSADLAVAASGVFWPAAADPLFPLVGVHPFPSSDHRLVWVDVEMSDQPSAVSDRPDRAKPNPADR